MESAKLTLTGLQNHGIEDKTDQLMEALAKHSLVEKFWTKDECLIIMTRDIVYHNSKKKDYLLGQYYVKIDFAKDVSGSRVKVFNRLIGSTGERVHPHIKNSSEGIGDNYCMGQLQAEIATAIAQYDFEYLVNLILSSLQQVTEGDAWGGTYENWPEVNIKPSKEYVELIQQRFGKAIVKYLKDSGYWREK